ncbi:hypothetical protein AA0313_2445 [Acetobacter indonesiensis NRIC 0313]|uniref:Uncharacterized protein n=1 Tax=Acetobacter indonesiensis TaxID=104101 RepID=A0A6N3T2N2_9PROT|nr:hypothetical protein Abin_006_202 [Acetobacter indonesiensis]GBQ60566.1 hypothetical protein AA0313_2445 [Acetobacter indonesiensis NRIC 0313]GEN02180.1 hypothetical protein AIN02nite_02050 [Acetobacter indonesiensis]
MGVSLPVSFGKAEFQGLAEICHQVRKKTLPRSGTTYQNKIKPVEWCISLNQPHHFPQPATCPVAYDGIPDLLGNSEPDACGVRILTPKKLKDKTRHRCFTPTCRQKEKLFPILQALGTYKPRSRSILTFIPVHITGLPVKA